MKKLFLFLSILAVFAFFLNAPRISAMTAEEITVLIAKLQAQIADLQKQLLSAQNAPVAWCHDFNLNLKYGDNSSEVEELKTALIKDGVMPYMAVDYDFDEETASYIVAFQEKYASEILTPWGLKHGTGFAGKSTRAKLNKLYGCGVAQSSIPAPFVSVSGVSEQVKCIFNGSISKQKCYSENNYSCSGIESCVVDVKGLKGEKMTWKSSCGGYADTIIDGQNKYAEFKCAPSITVLSPNGGETYLEGQIYKIKWNATKGVNRVMIGLQGPSSRTILASTSASTGFYSWTVPTDIVASSTYKILIGDIDSSVNDESDDYFSIMTTATPSITVLSPNGGEKWQNGQTYTVIWTSSNMPADAQNRITIGLILKGTESNLKNFISLIGSTANDGNESITIPSSVYVPAGDYKLWVKYCPSSGGECSVKDSSDNYFSIAAVTSAPAYKTEWNGETLYGKLYKSIDGNTWKEILKQYKGEIIYTTDSKNSNIIYAGDVGGNMMSEDMDVDLLRSTDGGDHWTNISKGITSHEGVLYGVDSITLNTANSNIVKVTVRIQSGSIVLTSLDGGNTWAKESTTPSITVLSPNGGESWQIGKTYQAIWTSNNLPADAQNRISIGLILKGTEANLRNFISLLGITANDGIENITIPSSVSTGDYRLQIEYCPSSGGECSVKDSSDNYLSIAATTTPSITVTFPNVGEKWAIGSNYDIKWTATGVEKVIIYLYDYAGTVGTRALVYNVPASNGKYSWTIPSEIAPSDMLKIAVRDSLAQQQTYDLSDNYFSIVATTTTSTSTALIGREDQLASISTVVSNLMAEVNKLLGK